MATLQREGKTVQLPDGAPIIDAAKQLGIPFGCEAGICGTCMVAVAEGMENLFPRNEAELQMGLDGQWRLCCQARIKEGTVVIR